MTGVDRLMRLREDLKRVAEETVLATAEEARARAVAAAPVATGRLRASIRVEQRDGGAAVVADCPYAAAVELGSGRAAAQPFLGSACWGLCPLHPRLRD